MLKCQEVEQKIGSDEIRTAGLMERLAVNLHLLMCRHCRNYARQIRAIGNSARDVFNRPHDPDTLAQLKSRIMDKLRG
jgi:anti-sigma factor ChrR (cupin superfamily)